MKKSLKRNMICIFCLTIVILYLVTGILNSSISKTALQKQQNEKIAAESTAISAMVSEYFTTYSALVKQMACDQNVVMLAETLNKGDELKDNEHFLLVMNMLKKSASLDPDNILTVYMSANKANIAFDNADWISNPSEYDVTTRDWFEAVNKDGVNITLPYEDTNTNSVVVTISYPIKNNYNKVVGVAAADINITTINQLVSAATIGKTGFCTLVSPDTTIVSSRDDSLSMKMLKDVGINAESLEVNSISPADFNSQPSMVAKSIIGNTGWYIVSSLPVKEYNEAANQLVFSALLMAFAGIVINSLVISIVVSAIIKRIAKLEKASTEIADGALDVQIDVKGKDELSSMGISLQKLTARLREYIAYIEEIQSVLNQVSNGNLTFELQQEYTGDFSKIRISLENMRNAWTETIGNIATVSNQVDSGAQQVSLGANALSDGASQQAAAVQELSATISEISSQISENAHHAQNADAQTKVTIREITDGQEHMKSLMEAIKNIDDKSIEINKIIKSIDDIAFQTNILALNAAVEAARAGAAGKGFAVVADEVRNLAQKSAQAAKNTALLIEETLNAIHSGSEITETTAASFDRIVENTKIVSDSISLITDATVSQAREVEQVNTGIEQVSQVVQANSATAEESAASAEQLSAQSKNLEDLINQFQVQ